MARIKIKDVAQMLGISWQSIYKWNEKGYLPNGIINGEIEYEDLEIIKKMNLSKGRPLKNKKEE